jgi:putative PIN family toxin of toxin-antitoxin system
MRVVLDTNVLVSALLAPASLPGTLLRFGREGRLRLLTSQAMLDELKRVLAYPRIAKRIGWTAAQRGEFVMAFARDMEIVDIANTPATVPADAGDNMVLATLIASGADALITGDAGLLELANRYPILTPTEFLGHIRGGK